MAGQKRWVVTLSGQRPLASVRSDLEAAGLEIEQVLEEIGVITGTAGGNIAGKLRGVAGVENVEPEQEIDVGPPDGPSW